MLSTQHTSNGPTASLTRHLAEFVSRTSWDEIPAEVQHEAKRALVNYFAVCTAGARDPDVETAIKVYKRFSANAQASVIGRSEKMDVLNAASINAMTANVYDFDDTHIPTIIHPTAPVAAALFALAEMTPVTGREFLLALVLGIEIECRLGGSISPTHYQRGWHITSTCGVFGAAAACSRLLKLDIPQIVWAFGNASAQSSGLVETLGSMSKSVGVGNAARNGLLSALLAAEGFSGPDQPLEGVRGFLNVMGENPDLDLIKSGLGAYWELSSNTYKPYPCGVVLNPVIESCIALHAEKDWFDDELALVELTGHPLLRQRTDRPHVNTGRASQVCAQHAVMVGLLTGRAGLAEFSDMAVADPRFRNLYAKVKFVDDESYPVESATVCIHLKNGRTLTHKTAVAHGSLNDPLTDKEIEDKFKLLAQDSFSPERVDELVQTLWALDEAVNVGHIMKSAQDRNSNLRAALRRR